MRRKVPKTKGIYNLERTQKETEENRWRIGLHDKTMKQWYTEVNAKYNGGGKLYAFVFGINDQQR